MTLLLLWVKMQLVFDETLPLPFRPLDPCQRLGDEQAGEDAEGADYDHGLVADEDFGEHREEPEDQDQVHEEGGFEDGLVDEDGYHGYGGRGVEAEAGAAENRGEVADESNEEGPVGTAVGGGAVFWGFC